MGLSWLKLACFSTFLLLGVAPVAIAEQTVASVAEKPLLLGVFPRRSATATTQLFTPLTEYLSASLERPVQLVTSKDFSSFWKDVEQKRYDIVHYNQYHYIKSSDDYEVFALNEEFGKRSISGALSVRTDSGIESIGQLRGRKVIFGGGEDAMMSYIVPRYLLQQSGLQTGDYETAFATNPPNSVLAVFFRQADAAGAGDIVASLPVITSKIDTSSLRILKKSEALPHLPWVTRKDLEDTLKQRIRKVLYALNDDAAGRSILKSAGLTGLHPASDSDFDAHRKIIEAISDTGR